MARLLLFGMLVCSSAAMAEEQVFTVLQDQVTRNGVIIKGKADLSKEFLVRSEYSARGNGHFLHLSAIGINYRQIGDYTEETVANPGRTGGSVFRIYRFRPVNDKGGPIHFLLKPPQKNVDPLEVKLEISAERR